ncbi:endolytic transglycosylase MltG [Caminicella sporogenes]|uniref:endolytic transglycosylase MltG n=1 Tax=Caminicella sporogenes TaxID=166485 RepID=UPI002541D1A6|nr:endolytic transglycosylase MltG [Caminicella sporogenes]WIF95511.1 endolytic transglycosylase MltG [Caminicella sporogenes]
MNKQGKIFTYIGMFVIGIILTITGLMNIVRPVVKYVDYTDAQIKQKARELGMVELKEVIEMNTEKINSNKQSSGNVENKDAYKSNSKNNSFKEYVLFKIYKGESSQDIINRLYKEGIIDDKESFTKLVAKKKAGRYLVYGTYKLYKGMDYEEIIKILTGK